MSLTDAIEVVAVLAIFVVLGVALGFVIGVTKTCDEMHCPICGKSWPVALEEDHDEQRS